jgi:hypothetical protein
VLELPKATAEPVDEFSDVFEGMQRKKRRISDNLDKNTN